MGKYDNVTMKEYMKKKKEMFDDLKINCNDCHNNYGMCNEKCPLNTINYRCTYFEIYYFDKALEIVMEYDPKVDWSKVEVDTKVLVKSWETNNYWQRRYFAKYEDGNVYTYLDGLSSFTYDKCKHGYLINWQYAKLYKGDE